MSAQFVDYAALKRQHGIDAVANWLGLELKKAGEQLRGPCPIHGGGDRALVITPAKGVWYNFCKACMHGGDVIELVAKVRSISTNEAALAIQQAFGGPRQSHEPRNGPMQPLDYLDTGHELLAAFGLEPATCAVFGAGYAGKGIMRGTIAIPVHDGEGTLLGYVGARKGEALRFAKSYDPSGILFNAHRIESGKPLFVTDDPVKVMVAHQMDIQAIAFLVGITPPLLAALSILMQEHGIASAEIL